MAVKKITQLTCDRCGGVMEEADHAHDIEEEEAACVFHMEGDEFGMAEPIQYYDLCEKCRERVKNLVDQITLAPKPKEKNGEAEAQKKRKPKAPAVDGESEVTTAEAPN